MAIRIPPPHSAPRCHSEPVRAAKQVPLGCTLAWESVPRRRQPPPTKASAEQGLWRDLIIAPSPGGVIRKRGGAKLPAEGDRPRRDEKNPPTKNKKESRHGGSLFCLFLQAGKGIFNALEPLPGDLLDALKSFSGGLF